MPGFRGICPSPMEQAGSKPLVFTGGPDAEKFVCVLNRCSNGGFERIPGGVNPFFMERDHLQTGSTLVLWSSCLAMLAVGANSTAIMAALPDMRGELSLSSDGVQWAVNAYLVV